MNLVQDQQSINILLCEDNLGDVYLISNYLQSSDNHYNLDHLANGEAVMNYLTRQGVYRGVSRPDLILLDLNLPKKHGFEVLQEIKTNPEFKTIPVVILTSSKSEKDIFKSYELYSSGFVTKPADFDEFIGAIQKIEKFWLNLVQLPSQLSFNN